jgi:hypothetical protein
MQKYSDLMSFFEDKGLAGDTQNFILGIDMNRRSELKRHAAIRPDDPLPADLSLALRVYAAEPAYIDRFREIKGTKMYQFIQGLGFDITLSSFGLLFGREQSSGYRWVTLELAARPTLQRTWVAIMESAKPEELILNLAETAGIPLSRFRIANDIEDEDENDQAA